uniref:Uncharacterized protein n=1 Tax=Knipowitschia caucasica TaxID=637954 RepID=A0AAV2KMH5_KNICA
MSRKRQLTMEEAFGAGGTIRRSVGDGHEEGGGDLPRPSVGKKPEATAKAKSKHLAVGGSPCRARRSRAAARSSSGPRRSRESSSSDTGSSELWEPEADPNSSDSSPDSPRATGRAVSRVLGQSRSTNAGKRRPTGATLSRGAASVSAANTGVKKRVAKGKGGTWRKSGWKPTVFPFTATPGPLNAAAELESTSPADFLELMAQQAVTSTAKIVPVHGAG